MEASYRNLTSNRGMSGNLGQFWDFSLKLKTLPTNIIKISTRESNQPLFVATVSLIKQMRELFLPFSSILMEPTWLWGSNLFHLLCLDNSLTLSSVIIRLKFWASPPWRCIVFYSLQFALKQMWTCWCIRLTYWLTAWWAAQKPHPKRKEKKDGKVTSHSSFPAKLNWKKEIATFSTFPCKK